MTTRTSPPALLHSRAFRAVRKDLAVALVCALGLVAILTGVLPARADATPGGSRGGSKGGGSAYARAAAAAAASDDSLTLAKTLTRTYYAGGEEQTDTRDVTVTVDKHTDLQSRERIAVSWTGAHPSGGRVPNPYGNNGMGQEYPVVVMECRGLDDDSLPADQRMRPSTCWTATPSQRSASADTSQAIWLKDRNADADDLGQVSGIDPSRLPDSCPVQEGTSYHVTPFEGAPTDDDADGTFYPACSNETMPPEANSAGVDPPNEMAGFTGLDGTGTVSFEVRTTIENESLGCSETVPCSLVVVPIMGISCNVTTGPCNSTGFYDPGSQTDGTMAAPAVSPLYWWSASNWDQRFSIPLDFAPAPNTCSLLASGDPVPFYGSELLSQAALQWAPAYCLDKARFNWQFNTMPDDAALSSVNADEAVAAEVTGRGTSTSTSVGFAPTAVSGWAIAFAVDKPGNAGEQLSLRLNPRLLAKLLTESYPGSTLIQKEHPGFASNPLSINLDPEFQALNPGLDSTHFTEAAATLMSLSVGSDVIRQLTSYIAADADAAAFLQGRPDPWGMKVNPYYARDLTLPVSTWPLLDSWIPDSTGSECLDSNRSPYMPRIAAPVSDLRLIATALLLNWPNVNTKCTLISGSEYKIGRVDPQGIGNRFILGLVTLADAERYGLNVASLQSKPRTGGPTNVSSATFVAPTAASLSSAVSLMTQPKRLEPFTLPMAAARRSASAYPGTLVVHTAAKTYGGLPAADAQRVAQFITVSTGEGQVVGRGNGDLPAGYLPLRAGGVTGKLVTAAMQVRAAILAPAPSVPTTPSSSPTATPTSSPSPSGTTTSPTTPVGGPSAPTAPGGGASAPVAAGGVPTAPVAAGGTAYQTAALSSSLGGGVLPLLLFGGLAAGLVTASTRIVLRLRGLR